MARFLEQDRASPGREIDAYKHEELTRTVLGLGATYKLKKKKPKKKKPVRLKQQGNQGYS